MDAPFDCNLLKESFSEMSLIFVSKAVFFFVGQQFSEVALLLMKLINGVLKEGRYKKKGKDTRQKSGGIIGVKNNKGQLISKTNSLVLI